MEEWSKPTFSLLGTKRKTINIQVRGVLLYSVPSSPHSFLFCFQEFIEFIFGNGLSFFVYQ